SMCRAKMFQQDERRGVIGVFEIECSGIYAIIMDAIPSPRRKAMGIIGGTIGNRVLCTLFPNSNKDALSGSSYSDQSKLDVLLGKAFWEDIQGKTVLDFGCGHGQQAIEIAQRGAERVIGLDIRETVLEEARQTAEQYGVTERCVFTSAT